MREAYLNKRAFRLLCGCILSLVLTAEATGSVNSAPVFPIDRVYPLVDIDGDKPSQKDWARASVGEGFFVNGIGEHEGSRAVFKMLRGKKRLHVRVECLRRPDDKKGSIEFYITQSGKADFPCIAVLGKEDGECLVGLVARARTWWIMPDISPIDETVIPRKVSKIARGWKLEFSLPFEELKIPREGFIFNVAHGLGLVGVRGERFAWCDLGGRMRCTSNQFKVYGSAVSARKSGSSKNGLKLPVGLSVGRNELQLERPDAGARLQIGKQTIKPTDGVFNVVVRDRGPLDMRLTDAAGEVIASYHADVRRPLLIDVAERYLPADAKTFKLDVSLNVAGAQPSEMVIVCRRGKGKPQEHKVMLKPGSRVLNLPVPSGDGYEVRVTARAAVATGGSAKPVAMDALHWFAVGVTEEDVAVYRKGIRSLPTDRLCWAIIADALPSLLQSQRGDGQYYVQAGRTIGGLWWHMCVYVPALLYKTEHPDNPYYGDKRLLDSAIMGMEYALRPEIRTDEYGYPDGSRQGVLLTYELLKDDIEPERRAYWAKELQRSAEAQIGRSLRNVVDKYGFYSIDCDTSTNDMAYYTADVYLAGALFDREDWKQLGTMLMRRLARHGRDGYFEEQRGSPVNHYTWMTAGALGEYYERSGDKTVLPTLETCARYMTAITTADGGVMALHDSRNSHHWTMECGEHVLSFTPQGRTAARAVILNRMHTNPLGMRGRTLFRMAENAIYFHAGKEVDFSAVNGELPFPGGIIVRKDGFQYGLSTIARGAVSGNYILDAQNAIEVFHNEAGCILNGGNSQAQPEAGSFWRKLDEPDWKGKTVGTSNDYLAHIATVARVGEGHELLLGYRTFDANIVVQVLSPTHMRLEAYNQSKQGPVTFSFFPGVEEEEKLTIADAGKTLKFRRVTFRANMPFKTEKGLRMVNPYSMKYQYKHKPVRSWLELKSDQRFIMDIHVSPKEESVKNDF